MYILDTILLYCKVQWCDIYIIILSRLALLCYTIHYNVYKDTMLFFYFLLLL
jgi:hypothetical protein